MRHLKRTAKLGRTSEHRQALLANLVCSLIKARRITTTLAKARAARPVAEKMMTLAKRGTLHDRRLASSRLLQDEEAVRVLFNDLAPGHRDRRGGYTRILKLHQRHGDAASLAILEWVEGSVPTTVPAAETKSGQPTSAPPAAAVPTPESTQTPAT